MVNDCSPFYIFDVSLLWLQYFYHRECYREQKGFEPSMWCVLFNRKFKVADKSIKLEDTVQSLDVANLNFHRLVQEQKNWKTDTDELEVMELGIANDIYMLGFVACINPAQVEKEEDGDHIKRTYLIKDERLFLFLSALNITGIQLTTAYMILMFFDMGEDMKGVHLNMADSFMVLLPRLMSSIMMHLNVIEEVDQGITMMKYAVNHPFMFIPFTDRNAKDGKERDNNDGKGVVNEKGMTRRVVMAFALGFFQATVGVIVEILIIYYLSTLTSYLKIICQYVAFVALIKFDNFYSKSIHDHGVKTMQKKNLRIYHRRFMLFKNEDEIDELKGDYHRMYINPRKDRCCLKVLRCIHKVYKIVYTSWGYYFMPLTALLLNFSPADRKSVV